MSDLNVRLNRLGLSTYYDALVAEGFDTWETVLDITESDLYVPQIVTASEAVICLMSPKTSRTQQLTFARTSLNVKLGHRRVGLHFISDIELFGRCRWPVSKALDK